MDTIVTIGVLILLAALFFASLPYLAAIVIVLYVIGWIANIIRAKNKPKDIPDNPYEEIFGNNSTNPFEDDYYTTSNKNPDVIDVEYTEHEDDSND